MTQERFLSGYCRRIDAGRTVCAELENGVLQEADCGFADCPYAQQCAVGKQLLGFSENIENFA